MLASRQEQIALARAALSSRIEQYAIDHARRLDNPKAPPLPPLAIRATVGLGKSAAAARLAQQVSAAGMPVLILVPTIQLAQEYAAKMPGAVVYKGRRAPEQDAAGKEITGPHTCYHVDAVAQAGARHHRPAQSVCRECKHGRAGAYAAGGQRAEQAVQWFRKHNITQDKISAIEPCRFLYDGLPSQMQADLLIAPHSAFSDALATHGPDRVQRLVIVDEQATLSEHIKITIADVAKWRTWCEQRADAFASGERYWINKNDPRNAEEVARWRHVSAELAHVIAALNSGALPSEHTGADGKTTAQRLVELDRYLKDAEAIKGGTASFERVQLVDLGTGRTQKHDTPLRALRALVRSVKGGTLRMSGSCTYSLHDPAPALIHAIKRGSTILMDATLDPILEQTITASGGEIYRAEVPSNVRLVRHSGHGYYRGTPALKNYIYTAQAALRDMHAIAEDMLRTHERGACALITHKAYLDHTDPDRSAAEQAADFAREFDGEAECGWFGAHDRGHNAWAGRHISILGMPLLNPQATAEAWRARQAIAALAGLQLDDWQEPAEGEILPSDPAQRAWLCDFYAATVAQAAGRARAIHQSYEVEVRLYGGIDTGDMDAALERAGLPVIERKRNATHSSTAGRRQGASDQDIQQAAEGLRAAGGRVSVQTVCDHLRAHGATVDRTRATAVLRELKTFWNSYKEASIGIPERSTSPSPAAKAATSPEGEVDASGGKVFNPKPTIYGEGFRNSMTDHWTGPGPSRGNIP